MIKTIPNVDPNGKYELMAAAEALQIHRVTLCRYRREGLIKASVKKLNGRAVYLGSEIIKFWRIYN